MDGRLGIWLFFKLFFCENMWKLKTSCCKKACAAQCWWFWKTVSLNIWNFSWNWPATVTYASDKLLYAKLVIFSLCPSPRTYRVFLTDATLYAVQWQIDGRDACHYQKFHMRQKLGWFHKWLVNTTYITKDRWDLHQTSFRSISVG